MADYIKLLETMSEYEAFTNSEEFVTPNVVYVAENNTVYYAGEQHFVYIQHIDGKLYVPSEWVSYGFSNNEANGVAVVTDAASFVIAKDEFASVEWHPKNNFVEGASYISVSSATLTDYSKYNETARKILSGKSDTDIIVAASNTGAAAECYNYNFPNGNKGYLPSIGQLMIAFDYINDVNEALTLINGTVFSNKYYFSSTQEKINATTRPYNAFVSYPKTGMITAYSKTNVEWVNTRPFTAL